MNQIYWFHDSMYNVT